MSLFGCYFHRSMLCSSTKVATRWFVRHLENLRATTLLFNNIYFWSRVMLQLGGSTVSQMRHKGQKRAKVLVYKYIWKMYIVLRQPSLRYIGFSLILYSEMTRALFSDETESEQQKKKTPQNLPTGIAVGALVVLDHQFFSSFLKAINTFWVPILLDCHCGNQMTSQRNNNGNVAKRFEM